MFGGLPGSKSKIGQSFPRGTTLLFYQAAAPIGWTKITTQNDKAIRVVSGAGGVTGGTNAFSSVMAQTVVGSTTLSSAQIPGHSHPVFLNDPGHTHGVSWTAGTLVFAGAGGNGAGAGATGVPSLSISIAANVTGITVRDTSGGGGTANQTATNAGGGGSHNHAITMAIQYIDVILASKN